MLINSESLFISITPVNNEWIMDLKLNWKLFIKMCEYVNLPKFL